APGRWALVFALPLALIAAIALRALIEPLPRWVRRVAGVAVVAAVMVECLRGRARPPLDRGVRGPQGALLDVTRGDRRERRRPRRRGRGGGPSAAAGVRGKPTARAGPRVVRAALMAAAGLGAGRTFSGDATGPAPPGRHGTVSEGSRTPARCA